MGSSGVIKLLGVIVALSALQRSAYAQRTPTISYISEAQIKDIGSTVKLVCSVKDSQDYPVMWIKTNDNPEQQLIISTGTALVLRDNRYDVRSDASASNYTLQIKDIQDTDAGLYQCQIVISKSRRISAGVELQVRRRPTISDNSTGTVVVKENQPAVLECYADGVPVPTISWRRENNALLPNGESTYTGNTLKIAAVKKEDRGTYYCVAENGVGRGARRNINLQVEFAPVITVPRPRLGQALQYDMDLGCHVVAYPPPAITWHKDEVQLSNNQHYSISHFGTADDYTDTILRVKIIEKEQYGKYVCKAANKLGSAEGQVELFETAQRAPIITYISEEQIKDLGSTVEFVCSVRYGQDYPVVWTMTNNKSEDQMVISTGTALLIPDNRYDVRSDASASNYTLQIKDIQETDAGLYQCQVLISNTTKISAGVELQVRRPPIISDNSTVLEPKPKP